MDALIHPLQPDWQSSLRDLITKPEELLQLLSLPKELLEPAQRAAKLFPLRVPREYVARIKPKDPADPLLMQILPIGHEAINTKGFSDDPLDEQSAQPLSGLVHKYKDRVLLITSGACAINCRYCFRRHFPYQESQISGRNWAPILERISNDQQIHEVILSGGDPLTASDKRLTQLINDLEQISHLQRIRIHTRLPVVIPSRITEELISTLVHSRLEPAVVVHINHPQEIDSQLAVQLRRVRSSGITLLNQSVLLAGVNDRAEVLVELSRALFSAGVLPYYLFALDPVQGASHFDLPEKRAAEIARAMQQELPGYLMPRLAREIPGRASKTLLNLN